LCQPKRMECWKWTAICGINKPSIL
jgi:hypothetical protein